MLIFDYNKKKEARKKQEERKKRKEKIKEEEEGKKNEEGGDGKKTLKKVKYIFVLTKHFTEH